jgi:hypothetical protein
MSAGTDVVGVGVDWVALAAAGELICPRGPTRWVDPDASEIPLSAAGGRLVVKTGGDVCRWSCSFA